MSEQEKSVTSLDQKRTQKKAMKEPVTREEFINQLPPEVQQVFNEYLTNVDKATEGLEGFVNGYVKQNQEAAEVSVMIEALSRVAAIISEQMDSQLDPETLPTHHQFRHDLTLSLNRHINEFVKSRGEEQLVISADVYTAILNAVVSNLQQYFILGVLKEHDERGE